MRVLLLGLALLLAGCTGSILEDARQARAENPTEPCGEVLTAFEPDRSYSPTILVNTSRGPIRIETYFQQVPADVFHVIDFATEAYYDGQRFYSISPSGTLAFGDVQTRDPDRRRVWGTVVPGQFPQVPLEHHRFLRHDEDGLVSLLVPAPDITPPFLQIETQPLAYLDDIMPVVGQVVGNESFATIEDLRRVPVDGDHRPTVDAEIISVQVLTPQRQAEGPLGEPVLASPDCVQLAAPGGTATFLLFLGNGGQTLERFNVTVDAPAGWTTAFEGPVVGSGQTRGALLNVTVPQSAREGTQHLTVRAEGGAGTAELELEVRVGQLDPVASGTVYVDFVALTDDGRVLDTTEPALAGGGLLPLFRERAFGVDPVPNRTDVGGREFGVFPGLQAALPGARLNEGRARLSSMEDAWGFNWQTEPRAGRSVWFVVTPRAMVADN